MYVNNEKVFSIRSNEIATIYLEPKYYIFRLETGGECAQILPLLKKQKSNQGQR